MMAGRPRVSRSRSRTAITRTAGSECDTYSSAITNAYNNFHTCDSDPILDGFSISIANPGAYLHLYEYTDPKTDGNTHTHSHTYTPPNSNTYTFADPYPNTSYSYPCTDTGPNSHYHI